MKTLNLPQAADFLGFAPSYLRKLVQSRRIPYSKPTGGKIIFLQEDLEAFVTQGRQRPDYELAAIADSWVTGKGRR